MLFLVLSLALQAQPEAVARVAGLEIFAHEVDERREALAAAGERATAAQIVEGLVAEALLAVEGQRRGLATAPLQARVESERRRMASTLFLEKELDDKVKVPDDLVRELFHAGADRVRLRLLVLPGRAQAQAARDRLDHGTPFKQEAAHSLARRGDTGEQGWESRGELDPAMAAAAFAAPLSKPSGPVQLRLGWGVFEVLERALGTEKELAQRRSALTTFARQQSILKMRAHYKEALRGKAAVKLDLPFLQALGSRVQPTPAEAEHLLAQVKGRRLLYRDLVPDILGLSRGMTSSHFSGPTIKEQLAWVRIDQLLVEEEALEHHYGELPSVQKHAALVQRTELARAMVANLRAERRDEDASKLQTRLNALVADLRGRDKVTIDAAAMKRLANTD